MILLNKSKSFLRLIYLLFFALENDLKYLYIVCIFRENYKVN